MQRLSRDTLNLDGFSFNLQTNLFIFIFALLQIAWVFHFDIKKMNVSHIWKTSESGDTRTHKTN